MSIEERQTVAVGNKEYPLKQPKPVEATPEYELEDI